MKMRNLLSTLFVVVAACSTKQEPAAETKAAVKTEAPAEVKPVAEAKGTNPESRNQVDADGIVRRGAAVSADKEMSVAETLANVATLSGKTVKVTGKVENVCVKKGCWMELHGNTPEERVRITMKDYGFFVPANSMGKIAVVEGPLEVKELSIEDAQHLEDERVEKSGETAKKITAPVKELNIVAAGLELRAAS